MSAKNCGKVGKRRTWLFLVGEVLHALQCHFLGLFRPASGYLRLRFALRRSRLETDNPDARQQDDAAERDHPALQSRQHIGLSVVDDTGDDRCCVVEAEGERADEGRAGEAEGAVEVRQLARGRAVSPSPIASQSRNGRT